MTSYFLSLSVFRFTKPQRLHCVPSDVVSVPSGAYAYMYDPPEGASDKLQTSLSERLNSNRTFR